MRTVIFAAAMAATAAAAVLSGCGGDVPRGRIHGTVRFQEKPLSGATIIFLASDNKTHAVKLKPDGSYEANGVALGPVKISVQQDLPPVASKAEFSYSSKAKGVEDEKAEKVSAAPVVQGKSEGPRLPSYYADADKSGLAFELNAADQEWSVDLK